LITFFAIVSLGIEGEKQKQTADFRQMQVANEITRQHTNVKILKEEPIDPVTQTPKTLASMLLEESLPVTQPQTNASHSNIHNFITWTLPPLCLL